MQVSQDIYEHLEKFVDDKDILNMLSVNKKFNDPIFFERALRRKYPFLLDFKTDNVSWRQFYVSMIFYISKMKELFPNDSINSFDPHNIQQTDTILWHKTLKAAFESTNIKLIMFLIHRITNIGFLFGHLAPRVVKQPMLDFLRNADYNPTLKELLKPLLDQGILSYSIILLFLINYCRKKDLGGEKNCEVDNDMNKYLGEYLDIMASEGLERNQLKYQDGSFGLLANFSLTHKTAVVTDETKQLLHGVREILR